MGGKIKIRAAVLLICGVLMLNSAAGCAGPNQGSQATASSEQVDQTNARTAVIVQMKTADGKAPGVEIRRNGEAIRGYVGMRLEIGDVVKTDRNTVVYLRIDEDKNLRLSADSSVSVTEAGRDRIRIQVEVGELFVNVENKLEDHEKMEFSAGSTTMSIRGTSLDIGYTDEDGLLLMVTDGHVTVTEDGSERETVMNGGQMTEVEPDDRTGEIRVEDFEIDELPENVLAELKTDETLRERVLSSMARTGGKTSEDLRNALNQRLSSVNGYDFGENFIGCAQSVWEKKTSGKSGHGTDTESRNEFARDIGGRSAEGRRENGTQETAADVPAFTPGTSEESHAGEHLTSIPLSDPNRIREENGKAVKYVRTGAGGTGKSSSSGDGDGSGRRTETQAAAPVGEKTESGSGAKPSEDPEKWDEENGPSAGETPANSGSASGGVSAPGRGSSAGGGVSAPGRGSSAGGGTSPNGGGSSAGDGTSPNGGGNSASGGTSPIGGNSSTGEDGSRGESADPGYSIDRNKNVKVYGENVNVRELIEFMREKHAVSMTYPGGRLEGWPEDSDFYKAVNDGHTYNHAVSFHDRTYDIEYSDEGMQIWFPDVDGVYDEIGDFEDRTTANNNALYNGLLTSHIAAPAGYAARNAMNLLSGIEKETSPAEAGEPDAGRTAAENAADGGDTELSNDGDAATPDLRQDEHTADGGNESADSGNEPADGGIESADRENESADGGNEPTDGGNEPADGGNTDPERSDEDGSAGSGFAAAGNGRSDNNDDHEAENASADTGERMPG
ncbi:FecR domain-containing protein [[Clostridium] aminophilum]|uniref:FecR domain-containing protein n=1 Tax=[Clostridium] aminophilum TaxID=1526 RepID=UPI0015A6043B|nr:FecR domain-containing protein [[Clostridium] aminophilum]